MKNTEYLTVDDVRAIIRERVKKLNKRPTKGAERGGAIALAMEAGISDVSISHFVNGRTIGVPRDIAEYLDIEASPPLYVRKNNQSKD